MPPTIKAVERYAFRDNNISQIVFPDGIIEAGGFSENNLTEVNFPDSVLKVGDFFSNNLTIDTLELPPLVETIDYEAFRSTSINRVVLPSTVKRINSYAFNNSGITELIVNSPIQTDRNSFTGNNFTSVNIPQGSNIVNNSFDAGVTINYTN